MFPALRAVVAFIFATETGTITELASGKSEPRHLGDWPWTELPLHQKLPSAKHITPRSVRGGQVCWDGEDNAEQAGMESLLVVGVVDGLCCLL